MNISSISAGSKSYLPIQGNSEIKMLEKQKEQLEKQIQTTKESNMDAKSKQDTIKLLREQIQQIETQIQQKRNEKLTEGINNNSDDNGSKSQSQADNTVTQEASLSGMSDLLQANASLSKARIMSNTKDNLVGKGNILEQEIKLDESRGVDPKAKKAELADIKARIPLLDKDMGAELYNSTDKVQDASESTDDDKSDAVSNGKKASIEGAGVNENTVESDGEAEESIHNKPKDNDPLTWFLENGDKYKKVDVLA